MANNVNAAPTKDRRVVLVDGCRTPFMRSNTVFADLTSYDLARFVLKGLVTRTQLDKRQIDKVIMGTVVSNITTSNVARDAMLGAGYAETTPAYTVTQACISANAAISNGFSLIRHGQAKTVVAGGTESLSDIPIRYRKRFRKKLIASQKFRSWLDYLKMFKGLRFSDLLPEIPSISEFATGRTMGEDADLMAARFSISRKAQDEFAMRSHQQAALAEREGHLIQDIVPVVLPPGYQPMFEDNGIRADTNLSKLARLKPAFIKPFGTVSAGNASFLTDGSAVVLLMEEGHAQREGYKPLAYLVDDVFTAQDPYHELLLGPAYAIGQLLRKHNLSLSDIDVFEIHEAFAGQVLANLSCLNSAEWCGKNLGMDRAVGEVPLEKLNVWGGSLSLGHPFGATGARLVHMAGRRLAHEKGKRALVAACAAGGQGYGLLIHRFEN